VGCGNNISETQLLQLLNIPYRVFHGFGAIIYTGDKMGMNICSQKRECLFTYYVNSVISMPVFKYIEQHGRRLIGSWGL
jgi:hypothetical protein